MKATVIYIKRFDFTDESGRKIAGTKVTLLATPKEQKDRDSRGREPITASADYSVFDQFAVVPGDYELETGFKRDAQGKALMTIEAVHPVGK